MEEELVSIITPLYNKEKYIEETIKSVENQTYTNWELIIIDDLSEDNGKEICNKYINEKIKVISLDKNVGPAVARNKGIDIAKGRYIAFLDADDIWEKDKLEKQINFMKENKYEFTYTQFQYIDENGKSKNKKTQVHKEINYKEALKNIRILTSTVMIDLKEIKKELVNIPDIKSEDIATWWNILRQGYIAYGLQECLVYYRVSKESLSGNKLNSAKNRWNLYRKYEKIPIIKSIYYFINYAIDGVLKRR